MQKLAWIMVPAMLVSATLPGGAPARAESSGGLLGPSRERFEAHLRQWEASHRQEVRLDRAGETSPRGNICATPPPTEEFLEESRAVVAAVSEETAALDVKKAVLARIPLFFHVLQTKSGTGLLPDQRIIDQVTALNSKFKSAGFQFYIEGIEDVRNDKWFKKCFPVNKKGKMNRKYFKMTKKLAVRPASTINVYTCQPPGDYLGFAVLAGLLPENHKWNAVVLHYLTLPGGPSPWYSRGITGVHEMGHYLGLWHTFHPGLAGEPNGCEGNGDEVDDTPFEAEPAYVCKARDTCPQPGKDPIRNFMDYTDDKCRRKFTRGQKKRMVDMSLYYRPRLFGVE